MIFFNLRYFIKLAYNGTQFHGWQSQPNAVSVQSTIEDALKILLRVETAVTGAGRTDTGVHARRMFAHFDSSLHIDDKKKFILSLNSLVGKNIDIQEIYEVHESAHARFDASLRSYKYFITFSKNPFLYDFCWVSSHYLDFDRMNNAAEILLSTQDFTSFAKLHSDVKTNICNVSEAVWKPILEDREAYNFLGDLHNGYVFTISADRFLRNMVRSIVGTLIDVGRHKISVSDFQNIISTKDRRAAGVSMPAKGLFLWSISYPFLENIC